MTGSRETAPSDGQELHLPESIQEIFRLGFDASKLEPGEIRGTPEQYEAAMQKALPYLVKQQQDAVARARALFLEHDRGGVAASVFARLDQAIASGDLVEVLHLCPNDTFAELLDHAATVDEAGDTEDAVAMYTLVQVLRPDQPMPYINNFNLVWRRAGVRIAAECYALIAPMMIDPIFFYYATDCFENAGLMDDAKRAILCAKDALDEELGYEIDEELAQNIRDYCARLHPDPGPDSTNGGSNNPLPPHAMKV